MSSEEVAVNPPEQNEGSSDPPAATSESPSQSAAETAAKQDPSGRVEIVLKACGDAPIMKKTKWIVDETKTVAWVCTFIRKVFKMPKTETLLLFADQAFSPTPDETLKNLYNCFGSDKVLVLHYSKTQAWG